MDLRWRPLLVVWISKGGSMKKEEIIENLTEVYNVLMDELSEEQIGKFSYSEEIRIYRSQ